MAVLLPTLLDTCEVITSGIHAKGETHQPYRNRLFSQIMWQSMNEIIADPSHITL